MLRLGLMKASLTWTSPDRALIDPPPKMSWVKKGFLMSIANNKAFLALIIFGGGSINARSGQVQVAV